MSLSAPVAHAIDLYEEGLPLAHAALRAGARLNSVRDAINRRGIPYRASRGEASWLRNQARDAVKKAGLPLWRKTVGHAEMLIEQGLEIDAVNAALVTEFGAGS